MQQRFVFWRQCSTYKQKFAYVNARLFFSCEIIAIEIINRFKPGLLLLVCVSFTIIGQP